jgi:predicted amidohydrolase YtcJ
MMMHSFRLVLMAFSVFLTLACANDAQRSAPTTAAAVASLVLVNGRVWTGDRARPEAEAIAIAGDRISAVGANAEIKAQAGHAQVIDLGGAFVAPGFIDTHVHFVDGGFRLTSVQLRDARTPEEFAARIAAFAKSVPAGTWITGGDWDHTLWGGELPRRDWIDAATPSHPVWVSRLDGHMALANSAALAAQASREKSRTLPAAKSCAAPRASSPDCSRTTPCPWSGRKWRRRRPS